MADTFQVLADRLDRIPWSRFHTTILVALGIGWLLDGFEVTIIGPILPRVATVFHLTVSQSVSLGSMFLFGAFLGAIVFGSMADRLGRRRLFLITLTVYAVFTFLSGFSWDYAALVGFRFLTGLGIGGEYSAVNSAIDEFIPKAYRGRSDGLLNAGWSLGSIAASITALAVLNILPLALGWRAAFFFGAVIALVVLWLRRTLPESPRWLARQGQVGSADQIVGDIERESGLNPETHASAADSSVPVLSYSESVRALFRQYPSRVVFAMLLNITEAAPYYGLLLIFGIVVLPSYGVIAAQVPLFYLYGGVLSLLGAVGIAFAVDKWGRKMSVTVAYAFTVIFALLFTLPGHAVAQLLFVYGGFSFFLSACGTAAYIVSSEIFPTEVRAMSIGFAVAAGRVAAFALPLVFAAIYKSLGVDALFVAMAMVSGVGLLAMVWWDLVGIEGKNRSLEEIADFRLGRPSAAGASDAPTSAG